MVNLRALKFSEHIAGVGRESLDIAPLPLGKDCVECERRLTAAAEAGDNCQRLVRYRHINIFEIVYPRTDNVNTTLSTVIGNRDHIVVSAHFIVQAWL